MALRVVAPGLGAPATGWRRADPLPEARHHRGAAQGAGRAGRTGTARAPATWRAPPGLVPAWCAAWRTRGCWFPPCCRSSRRSRSPTRSIPARSCRRIRQAAAADAAAGGGGARILRHAAGWRDRLRQDRGLSGGGGRMPAPGPPGAGAAAGDRAVLAVAGALRAPLRRGTGGVALGPDVAGAPRDLARGGRRAPRRWWSARARRCSCRSPISAWS